MWLGEEGEAKVRPPPPLKLHLYFSGNTFYLCWAAAATKWIHHSCVIPCLLSPWTLGCISSFTQQPFRSLPGLFYRTNIEYWTFICVDMFSSGQLVSTLLPAVFHSPAAHFFPAFPTRLGSPPQILIPGPFISYESLRSYLQPEPCKEALLLATQAVGIGALTESIGEFKLQPLWPKSDWLYDAGVVQRESGQTGTPSF